MDTAIGMPRASLARMSRVPSSRRRIRSAVAVGGLLCGALAVLPGGATATSLDPDRERELAQAHFQIYLLTHTVFRPTHITCTTPTGIATSGELVCYAIVDDRETISAVATPDGAQGFTFAALGKADGTGAGTGNGSPVTPVEPSFDDGDLDIYMESFEGDAAILEAMVADIAEIEVVRIAWQPEVSTLFVEVAGDGATPANEIAWVITDMLASAWERGGPVRAADVDRQPRLEIVVDGLLYGTPFDVMAAVADYEIGEAEWLEIVSTATAAGAVKPARVQPLATVRSPYGAAALADLADTAAAALLA